MPKYNWDDVEDNVEFTALPAGDYPCKVTACVEATTQKGDPMWNIELEVISGEFKGRKAFDRLVFSGKGLSRVKLVFHRLLGIELEGEMSVNNDKLLDGKGIVTLTQKVYEGKIQNNVPFDGYKPFDDDVI